MGRRPSSARAHGALAVLAGLAALAGACGVAPAARAPVAPVTAVDLPERDPAAFGREAHLALGDTPDDRDGTGIVGALDESPER